MNTKVWWNGCRRNVNPDKSPSSIREINVFLVANNAPMCFFKGSGGWFKLCKDGIPKFVVRTLYLLSLREWLEIAKNDLFTGNIK